MSGLKGYRAYRDEYIDNGIEVSVILQSNYNPDFHNRHTMQLWDAGSYKNIFIDRWIGTTLLSRSLHEIYITNNSNSDTLVTFSSDYSLEDELGVNSLGQQVVTIGPNGTAYFYCTGILSSGNLILEMRTGSQDDKKSTFTL